MQLSPYSFLYLYRRIVVSTCMSEIVNSLPQNGGNNRYRIIIGIVVNKSGKHMVVLSYSEKGET